MRHISQDHLNKITELRHLLHSRPDLSLREAGTIGILEDFLRENTTLEIAGRDGFDFNDGILKTAVDMFLALAEADRP